MLTRQNLPHIEDRRHTDRLTTPTRGQTLDGATIVGFGRATQHAVLRWLAAEGVTMETHYCDIRSMFTRRRSRCTHIWH